MSVKSPAKVAMLLNYVPRPLPERAGELSARGADEEVPDADIEGEAIFTLQPNGTLSACQHSASISPGGLASC
jgi:hypothetical protein